MTMTCVCCGTELENGLDTFGEVHQELCWDCYWSLWESSVVWAWEPVDSEEPVQQALDWEAQHDAAD